MPLFIYAYICSNPVRIYQESLSIPLNMMSLQFAFILLVCFVALSWEFSPLKLSAIRRKVSLKMDSRSCIAKDFYGDNITVEGWTATYKAGEAGAVQGLGGETNFLLLDANKNLETFALNATCTHKGCIVAWHGISQNFLCVCHGSKFSREGAVVQGPATVPLTSYNRGQDSAGNVIISEK